jgi:Domain of unknown function (DUF4249)
MVMEILNPMKRTFIHLLAAAAFLLTCFSSCERNADVELPDVPSKLALSCFISPQDTIIRAYVTRSVPIFSLNSGNIDPYQPYDGAVVTLTGNSSSIQLVYNQQTQMYEIPATVFPIVAGNTYSISVSAPQYHTLQAQTRVPLVAPSDFTITADIDIDSINNTVYPFVTGEIDHQFTDIAGETNYYMINALMETDDTSSAAYRFFDLARSLETDNNRDGQLIRGGLSVYTNLFYNTIGIRIYLTTSGFDYYEYHRTIYSGNNGGDPFSEPSLVYSNVTNGYGIFCGVNTTSVLIPL